MPAETILTQAMLDQAEVPPSWQQVLRGMTKASAADYGLDILDLRVLVRGVDAAGMVSYNIGEGQNVTSSMDEVTKLRRLLMKWKSNGGGPVRMGISLG